MRTKKTFTYYKVSVQSVRRPDISLARELLDWEPRIELREGLTRTLDEAGAQVLIGAGSQ
jgi:dTDP-glucose 4,6-dehydratase